MRAEYIAAIEARLGWLRWVDSDDGLRARRQYGRIFETYIGILKSSDTFFMRRPFCELVDQARRTIPGDMIFDGQWLQAKRGFLWLEAPFEIPESEAASSVIDGWTDTYKEIKARGGMRLRAVGWREVPPGEWLLSLGRGEPEPAPLGAIQFCFYMDMSIFGRGALDFSPWAYFVLTPGDQVDDRIVNFEERSRDEGEPLAAYMPYEGRRAHPLHEMRWLYAALFLMSQRIAIETPTPTDRATRRRANRNLQQAPPLIRVITLRRYEEDRKKAGVSEDVDWQWQWIVRGFWRNQYFPSENTNKPVWIDSYLKGPADKPLKPDSIKLFVAKR